MSLGSFLLDAVQIFSCQKFKVEGKKLLSVKIIVQLHA